MAVEILTELDMLTTMYNSYVQDKVVSEVNLVFWDKRLLTATQNEMKAIVANKAKDEAKIRDAIVMIAIIQSKISALSKGGDNGNQLESKTQ